MYQEKTNKLRVRGHLKMRLSENQFLLSNSRLATLCRSLILKIPSLYCYQTKSDICNSRETIWECIFAGILQNTSQYVFRVHICISKSVSLRHMLGYKKYKLFNVTRFILVLPTFRLIQQSLSKTRCWIKGLHSVLKSLSNGN